MGSEVLTADLLQSKFRQDTPAPVHSMPDQRHRHSTDQVERGAEAEKLCSDGILQLSVVPDDTETKETRENAAVDKAMETVKLCCMTPTTGPGTTFHSFKVPGGAKCSACGSLINQ